MFLGVFFFLIALGSEIEKSSKRIQPECFFSKEKELRLAIRSFSPPHVKKEKDPTIFQVKKGNDFLL